MSKLPSHQFSTTTLTWGESEAETLVTAVDNAKLLLINRKTESIPLIDLTCLRSI
jgi:hypothetical protein